MEEVEQGQELGFIINDLNARIRILENKYSLFGERLLVINQNMIEEYKKLLRKDRVMDTELKELKKEIFNIKEILSIFTKELKLFARKDSLKVLEKYINLWNPMNFVTEKEVAGLIKRNEEILSKKELLDMLREQEKNLIKEFNKEIKDRVLTKKDVLDLIKKEVLQKPKKVIIKESKFDLNADGIVDHKDLSLAGETLKKFGGKNKNKLNDAQD